MSTEIQVDDETRAALLLFNERVEASAAAERGKKRVAKAERAKDEAAGVVRKLNENPNASVEDKAAAEAEYKTAVENYQYVKANPNEGDAKKKPAPAAEAATADDSAPAEDAAPADDSAPVEDAAPANDPAPAEAAAPAEEASPAEVSADEEPAAASEAVAESE